MRELLPDVKFVQADNGELALALDGAFPRSIFSRSAFFGDSSAVADVKEERAVTLKRFPVQKSFWQQLAVRRPLSFSVPLLARAALKPD